ncbi:AAA family ATPase [Paenibacillus agilis]|uniref:Nuclease SbcCD subunit C n=1 Tax=Paenibacillus agilis TaxID=3020863 RepID=A0A559IZF8_9BACL|nr:AAA family ATPase [Paenibacillus agilis]TVX93015.1 hypothetical protein FPZ44_08060 [Paenibacillus agilis]
MTRIELERLTFSYFKGLRSFTLSTQGGNVDVYGNNGTGKTTLFDGFIWLLFGKDSSNRSSFDIKELDGMGRVAQHGLSHEVSGRFIVNGRCKTLKRVYAEKWVKTRGKATEELHGHTTSYYVDDVPVKQTEFAAEVNAIIKEDIFKLLTNPAYFNEQLKKEERRKILLDVAGDISDDEVIHSNKELDRFKEIIEGRTIEKHRAYLAERKKLINKEMNNIPIRIDEARRNAPDASELDGEMLQEDIQTLRERISAKEAELSRIQSGGEVSVKEKLLREIDSELLEIKTRLQSTALDRVTDARRQVDSIHREIDYLTRKIDDLDFKIKHGMRLIQAKEAEVERLRSEWDSINSIEFPDHIHEENCPSCGQELPDDQIQVARNKAFTAFNGDKSCKLTEISNRGKLARGELDDLNASVKRNNVELEALAPQLNEKQEALKETEAVLERLRSEVQEPTTDPAYKQFSNEKGQVQRELELLRSSAIESINKVMREIEEIRREVASLESDYAKIEQAKAANNRVAELEEQERKLASEYEQLEQQMFLMEEFVRTKVTLLESKINSKFKYARFRLFKPQINGGLEEVCDTLYNGIAYDSGLNNAARINVGLDIINTLSEHYGFSAPIFIDNAEAVTELIETKAQIIRLVVSEPDKKLRVVAGGQYE